MTDKERLEEIEKNLDPLGYGMGGHLISVNDIYWLVKYAKEQAQRVQFLEMRWELLKLELEQSESLNAHFKNDEAVDTIHDIQNLMSKMESGVYYKEFHE